MQVRDKPTRKSRFTGFCIRAVILGACALTIPRIMSGYPARSYFNDDRSTQLSLGNEVKTFVDSGVAASAFHTGNTRFDGEWAFGTFTMAALGLGHVILHHPEQASAYTPTMEKCAEQLVSPATNAFGTEAWGTFGFEGLPRGTGHAYLGYSNLALSMIRLVQPQTRFARMHDDLTEALAKRLSDAPHALFQTYPGEAYPADISMVAASIALHDCAVGTPKRDWWDKWRSGYTRWIDASSGLLFQSGDAETGRPVGPPRASGTAIAAFALAFVDKDLADKLHAALERAHTEVLGYGAIREYAPGHEGSGDIDSGPVVFGVSVSATGFTLASAKVHRNDALFTSLFRTADFWGIPVHRSNGMRYLSGGPLGNAILLAMTTATSKWQQHCRNGSKP